MKRPFLAVLFLFVASPSLAEELLFEAPNLTPAREISFDAEPDLAETEEAYEQSPVVYPEVEELSSQGPATYAAPPAGYHYGRRAAPCRRQANLYNNGYAGYGYRYGGLQYYYMPSMPYYHPEYGYNSYRPLHHAPRQRKSRYNYGY